MRSEGEARGLPFPITTGPRFPDGLGVRSSFGHNGRMLGAEGHSDQDAPLPLDQQLAAVWAAFGQALAGGWDDEEDDGDGPGGPPPVVAVDPAAELVNAYERAVAEGWEHQYPEAFARLRRTYDTFRAVVERRTPQPDTDITN